ncbi:FAD-linked oxidoreductase [Lachnellula subtilissima]|uniref:FAD-linked oxidoreductase n=1 Tax=Lachnellula subtilissima TaxID=602034 RepID=A0A8H8U3A6_9HELO|nr:FAD-linked oxidoreductase [Lachnellula subtilissima]
MSKLSQLPELKAVLTPGCQILTDTSDAKFVEYLKRWTDIDLMVPGAIVLPTSEDDCQKIVQWASNFSVPFVMKSGGHSEYSTIGSNGIIIDLSLYKGIEVDKNSGTATLKGSILTKDVAIALAEAGCFTALGNGNTVGAIPYFLAGGASLTPSITGFGADQILSAHLITAKGELVNVTGETHPDLLYGLRGAGQFLGLVTVLVIKCYPLHALGNDLGTIWAGAFVFPLSRASEVTSVMKNLMDDDRHATAGLMMIMAPPPARNPCLVIATKYTGDPEQAPEAYKALYKLQPIVANGASVPIQNANDAQDALGAKGDFKRFGIIGLHRFEQDSFLKTIELWKELVAECPDAINTSFNFKWDSRPAKKPGFESAMSLHDIRYFQNNLIWHTDAKNRDKVDEYNSKSYAIMRSKDNEADFVDFPPGRAGPVQRRYRGVERLARLRSLKREWDPAGVFTNQLIE